MALRFRLVKYDNLPRIRGLQQLYRAGNVCATVLLPVPAPSWNQLRWLVPRRCSEVRVVDVVLLRLYSSHKKALMGRNDGYRSLSPAVLIQYWYVLMPLLLLVVMLRAAFLLSTCRSSVKRLAEVAGGLRFVSGSTAYWSCRKVPRRQKAGIRQDWQLGESENHWHLNLGAKRGEFWCGFSPTLGCHTQIHFIMVDFRIGLRNNLYDYYMTFQQIWE